MGGVGVIGRVLSSVWRVVGGVSVTDVKMDPGGGPNITAEQFQPAGEDSPPLPSDFGFAAPGPQTGRFAVLGYVDAVNAPQAVPGEKRTYARNEGGEAVTQIWQKADGTVVIENANGVFELRPDGSQRGQNAAGYYELEVTGGFVANGARLTPDGDVVTSDGVSLRNHPHVPMGPPPIPTE